MKTGLRIALKIAALIVISLIEPIGNALSQKPQQHAHIDSSETKLKKKWQALHSSN